MAVGVDEQGTAYLADLACEAPDEGAYPAGEHVEDGMLEAVALGVADRTSERVEVVEDRARSAQGAPLDAEAVGSVVLVLGILRHLVDGTGHVVSDAVRRPVLSELLHERLETAVARWNAFATDDVDVPDPVAHLAGPFPVEHGRDCLRYHLDIHQKRPLLDVLEVQVDHLLEPGVASSPHLPVAGEAGLDRQAAHGALVVLGDFGG